MEHMVGLLGWDIWSGCLGGIYGRAAWVEHMEGLHAWVEYIAGLLLCNIWRPCSVGTYISAG